MKHLYLLLCLVLIGFSASAQIPNGSTAPDWTLTDLDGVSHNLYDVLEDGKSVVIDFSATWCGPCWNYHQTGILDQLYHEYGPTGTVEQDKIRVYWIESDDVTNDACMTNTGGCTGGTQGDWTAGTEFTLFNPPNEVVPSAYGINSYPTLLAVCPNKKLYEVGQASKSTWVSWLTESCALDQSFLATDEACFMDGSGGIDLTVTGGAGNITYFWNNGQTTEDLVGVGAGTYSCTITEGRGVTAETGDITISGPSSAVGVNSSQVTGVSCNGMGNGSVTVSGMGGVGNYTYAWDNGGTGPTISGLSPNTYSVVVTDSDGCTFETSYLVEEPEVLSEVSNMLPEACDTGNGTIFIQANGGTGPFTYDIGVQQNNSGAFNNLASGVYNYVVTDANGCDVTGFIEVTELDAPVAVAVADGEIDCNATTLEISGEGSTTGGLIVYSWTTTDGMIVGGETTLNPEVSQAGTYTLVVTDVFSLCTETASVTVTENTVAPVSSAGTGQTIDCVNLTVDLDGSQSSSGSNIEYLWTTINGNIVSGETSTTPEVNAGGIYELTVTNLDNGCTSVSSVEVMQAADLPIASAGEVQTLTCMDSEVMLDGSASSEGGTITYLWTTDDGTIVSGSDSQTPLVNASGTYLLEVSNSSNGCIAYASVEVTLDVVEPEITVEEPQVLTCVMTEQMLLANLPSGDYAYNWTTTDGEILDGNETNQPLIGSAGTYMVEVLNLENGCSSSQTVEVTEFINTPLADYTSTSDDKMYDFMDNSGGEPTAYFWEFGDTNTSTEQNPSHEYAENGMYEVCLTVTNECGDNKKCATVNVSAGSSLEYTQLAFDAFCNAECNGIADITPADDVENYTISTDGPDGFASDLFTMDGLCAGTYTFTITNEIDESVDGTFEILEPAAITVGEETIVQIDCYGNEIGSIALQLEGGVGEISVSWDNGFEGNMIENLGPGDYVASATDENGCIKTFEYTIIEPTELELTTSSVTNIDDNNPTGAISIVVDGGTPDYQYLWSSGEQTKDISGLGEGEYNVIVTDANNCKIEFGPFTVKSVVSINEIDVLDGFAMTPNPANEQVNIMLDFSINTDATVSMINNLGQIVSIQNVSGRTISHKQNVSDLTSGLYFVKITVGNQSIVKKLIIE